MADFEDKLASILGNQAAMDQIMALARSLSAESTEQAAQPAPQAEGPPETEGAEEPDLSQLLGGLDPGMLQTGMRLVQEYQSGDDRRAALLQALRPFLREQRRARLDQAVRIARMTRLIRGVLGSLGAKGDAEGI